MNTKRYAVISFFFLFFVLGATTLFVPPRAGAQQAQNPSKPPSTDSMAGMDMGDMRHGAAAQSADDAMSGHHMDMGAHMFMTELRPEDAADEKRAAELVETLRRSIGKYKDYHAALDDGFQIFMPNIPQEHYHFTNYRYALEASFAFNPEHPTSLLYKKTRDGYELEGAMYTAPKRFTEEQLNERVPLSVARWHRHINLCLPPKGVHIEQANLKEFGLRGSIASAEACEQAGGRWIPQIFGWMVHVYPYETEPEKIWAH
jgi:hypothetical protein